MEHRFKAGDFLFFQLEAGFALIRVLDIEEETNDLVWHLVGYNDLFPDIESIERAVESPDSLSISIPHVALTNRAFESTQVADIGNAELSDAEKLLIKKWTEDASAEISDRSIRLHLGLR
jgi:hypothetical protein